MRGENWNRRPLPEWEGATPDKRAAFTLVEAMVLIAILGLLTGLLLPAVNSVRVSARQTACQSNLRQMAIAAEHYTALWDIYPAAIRYESRDGTVHRVAWDWVTTVAGQLVEPGPLWKLTDHPDRVMQCPGYRGKSNYSGDPHTGYNYNISYIGAENYMGPLVNGKITNTPVHAGARPGAIRSTQTTAVFGIGGYTSGANKYMRSPLHPNATSPSITYSGGQAFLYHDQTNVAWADGHVSAVEQRYKGLQATPQMLRILRYPKNGFLSNDDGAYDLK